MRLKDKVAIVTGGSRGIGLAVVENFLKEGAKVAICGSKLTSAENAMMKLKETYEEENMMAFGVNMVNTDEIVSMVEQVIARWGKIDILVNNAGITAAKPLLETTDEEFRNMLEINVEGMFRCTREVVKYMKEYGGSIINTSSMVGLYGAPRQSAYTASKFAVNGLTKSCAKELGPYQIRVNAVAPGVVETDMMKESVSEEMKQGLIRMTPLKKVATTEDLAGAYVYLASDESKFTTGTIISVDGGFVQ